MDGEAWSVQRGAERKGEGKNKNANAVRHPVERKTATQESKRAGLEKNPPNAPAAGKRGSGLVAGRWHLEESRCVDW